MTAEKCSYDDHPSRPHGHYGYGGRYWCSDLRSPLLSADNGGVVRGGYIVVFAREANDAR